MKEKYIKPEMEVIELETTDSIATSVTMVQGTVGGTAGFTTEQNGMSGGTVGGIITFE